MENRKKVIQQLKSADVLLVVLPMLLITASLMTVCIINDVPGMFQGLLTLIGFFASLIFCAVYVITALILSLATYSNQTFRIRLFISLVAILTISACFIIYIAVA